MVELAVAVAVAVWGGLYILKTATEAWMRAASRKLWGARVSLSYSCFGRGGEEYYRSNKSSASLVFS